VGGQTGLKEVSPRLVSKDKRYLETKKNKTGRDRREKAFRGQRNLRKRDGKKLREVKTDKIWLGQREALKRAEGRSMYVPEGCQGSGGIRTTVFMC